MPKRSLEYENNASPAASAYSCFIEMPMRALGYEKDNDIDVRA